MFAKKRLRLRQKSSIHLCQRPWRILLSQSCILTRKLAFCKSIWCGHAPSVLLLTTRSFFKIGISNCKLYQKNTFQFEEAFANFMKFLPFWLMSQNVGFFSSCDFSTFYKKNIVPDNGLKLYACNGYLIYKLWICQQSTSNYFFGKVK